MTVVDAGCAGAMKHMKIPKGGMKGGRMPQMNMDPAQMAGPPTPLPPPGCFPPGPQCIAIGM